METEVYQLYEHNKKEYPPMHTAEHLLNQTMMRMFGCERSKNAHIERKKSKINYRLTTEPTIEEILEIERKMNEVINQNLKIRYEYVKKDEVPKCIPLDKLPDDASETLRLVYIGDYDVCACIGNHVDSTNSLGVFKINSTSYKEGDFRIVFKLVPKE